MINFRLLLSPKRQKQWAIQDEYYAQKLLEFKRLSTANLIATARAYLHQMKEPLKYGPEDTVTYDGAFYHLVLPEILARLSKLDQIEKKEK